MIKLKVNNTVTCRQIFDMYRKYPNENIIIVIPNTKMQSEEEMRKIAKDFPNITFSVTGGLNPAKSKFNNEHYQKRTYYSPMELSKIVSIFRSIEKQIDLGWTETQKAMFVYKKLCDKMEYGENYINGKDYSRGIGGLLYNKAVCSGFAMIYKEALDRLGIECHYQNKEGYHSWNIARLDGKYRALELTWDVSAKGPNGCGFRYFNSDNNFYAYESHDIRDEKEESFFPIVPYTSDQLQKDYNIISNKRILKLPIPIGNNQNFAETPITIESIPSVIRKNNDGSIIIRNEDYTLREGSKSFFREDGTHFALVRMKNNNNNNDLHKFLVIDETQEGVQLGKVFSEADLVNIPSEYDSLIANGLLSKGRLKRKMLDYNGYVGYVGINHNIYYDENIERSINIIR